MKKFFKKLFKKDDVQYSGHAMWVNPNCINPNTLVSQKIQQIWEMYTKPQGIMLSYDNQDHYFSEFEYHLHGDEIMIFDESNQTVLSLYLLEDGTITAEDKQTIIGRAL